MRCLCDYMMWVVQINHPTLIGSTPRKNQGWSWEWRFVSPRRSTDMSLLWLVGRRRRVLSRQQEITTLVLADVLNSSIMWVCDVMWWCGYRSSLHAAEKGLTTAPLWIWGINSFNVLTLCLSYFLDHLFYFNSIPRFCQFFRGFYIPFCSTPLPDATIFPSTWPLLPHKPKWHLI